MIFYIDFLAIATWTKKPNDFLYQFFGDYDLKMNKMCTYTYTKPSYHHIWREGILLRAKNDNFY